MFPLMNVVCCYCCACLFPLEQLFNVIFVVLVPEVYPVLAVQKAVYVELVFDVEGFIDFVVSSDFVIETVAVLAH
jgi:hypothetical protein